ncbi:MAG: hypothetical protein WCB96_14680 [Candidatus Aminicenantales bacterium]
MELLLGVTIGLIGIALTVFYGVRSKKLERYLEAYHSLDLQKRDLLSKLASLQHSHQAKDAEISALRTRIEEIDRLSDAVQDRSFDPRKLKWTDRCPKCGNAMYLDDVDFWYRCHKCGHEEAGDKQTTA